MKALNDPFPRLVPSLFLPLYFYHGQQRRITSTGARTADVVTKNEPNRWEGHQNPESFQVSFWSVFHHEPRSQDGTQHDL